jgi:hypothetical protein
MPNFNKNRGFNMKSKGNFDFGNKGIYDIKTETKDQSVVEADKSTEKKSIFKKYAKSPVEKDTGEVVSKNSPGSGWTKTKGTNIWAPPVADKQMLGRKKGRVKDSIKKVARPSKKSTITDNTEMKPPRKKPVGPRA